MPRLLAVDTATEACSVALGNSGRIVEQHIYGPREHMQQLLPMIEALLDDAGVSLRDVDAIAFGRGPGSFTGVRIGLGVVQGLAFATGLPLIPVSTLATLAQSAVTDALRPGDRILAAIDARMDEVYWGWFELDGEGYVVAVSDEHVSLPERVDSPVADSSWIGVGSGWRHAGRLPAGARAIDAGLLPHASALLQLALPLWEQGAVVGAEEAVPVYLRDDVAWPQSQG
jgi:tRNA threonylcarbamoyladenosine biosynthesis protein TsaB